MKSTHRIEIDGCGVDVTVHRDARRQLRPVVFGISFGGRVAIRHGFRHPQQAAGLIVASTTPRLPTVEQVARRMGAMGGEDAEQAWLRVHPGGPAGRSRVTKPVTAP